MRDLKGVDLKLLLSLEALVEEASVSNAAKRVGLSQPAMSASLARLRTLMNDPMSALCVIKDFCTHGV